MSERQSRCAERSLWVRVPRKTPQSVRRETIAQRSAEAWSISRKMQEQQ
ncbi:hypothetical protein ACFQZZ_20445 [Nocardia sp. GCM10030253]